MRRSLRSRLLHAMALLTILVAAARSGGVNAAEAAGSSDFTGGDTRTGGLDRLLLCTADGRLYAVDAWTGNAPTYSGDDAPAVMRTEPLIARSLAPAVGRRDKEEQDQEDEGADDDDSSNVLLPGLDGRLYWQQADGSIQALQLELASLLEQPVQSCREDDGRGGRSDCGILTATVETSLLALDAEGRVKWYDRTPGAAARDRHPPPYASSPVGHEDDPDSGPLLLLQRRDYHVRHVRSSTGTQAWNISLGTWQALDFGPPAYDSDESDEAQIVRELPGHVQDKRETLADGTWRRSLYDPPELPAIVFRNAGQTLVAVDLATRRVLWTLDTPSVVASVFGMHNGQWKPVQVLQEQDLMHRPGAPIARLAINDHGANEEDEESQKFLAYALQDWFSNTSPFGLLYRRSTGHGAALGSSSHRPDRSGVKPKFPRRKVGNDETRFCLPGDDCRNIPDTRNMRLLPAPPVVQPEGLLLSWSLVGALFLCFSAVTGSIGYFWYLRKKRKWMEAIEKKNDELEQRAAISNQIPAESTTKPEPNAGQSLLLDTPKDTSTLPSAPVTVSAIGGIPLVRYSRYATEFEELEPLGKGGFGTVWRVRNLFDGRHYAMKKVMIHGTADDPQFQQRLERTLREVKILAALDHPNIVRYYNAWLELEKDLGDDTQTKDSTLSDTDRGMTRCYSSSLLTDSVSQWPSTNRGRDRPSHAGKAIPLGRESDQSEERSLFNGGAWRPSAIDNGDYIVFESDSDLHSKENEEAKADISRSQTDVQSETINENERKEIEMDAKDDNHLSLSMANTRLAKNMRHILYIQMQLCRQNTIADLLSNVSERNNTATTGVDIPQALKFFQQIVQAVTYVHAQGLIHRDLKPANCFVDESGNVQVGDFGLSRESADRTNDSLSFRRSTSKAGVNEVENMDHTAGVGTRSYASPEQINGSDYESSTDIYSLGIILFELVYPMSTGMERSICLTRLRNFQFPGDFDKLVGHAFPTLPPLLLAMLSEKPSDRPPASAIVSHIKTILSEYTILSLDESRHQDPDTILLRIEAEHCADALTLTINAIYDAAKALVEPVEIVQYGLRSSNDGDRLAAIIELALKFKDGDGSVLVSELRKHPSIYSIRQVRTRSESHLSN